MEEREALEALDATVVFILLFVLSVLLSLWAVLIQRRQLRDALRGQVREADTFLLQWASGAITVGGVGFFFELALQGYDAVRDSGDCRAIWAARATLGRSLLVLAAAILRLIVLAAERTAEESGTEAAAEDLPA